MIFKDVFRDVSEKEILTALIDKYPDQKININSYLSMIEKLKLTQPEIDKQGLILCVFPTYDYFEEDIKYEEAIGYSEKDKECFALDLTPWSEWLGMKVNKKCLDYYGSAEFIAHCLYEMSFISFDENKIRETVKELQTIDEEIRNGTAKTYSMEEVFEELGLEPIPEKTEEEKQKEQERVKTIIKKNEEIRAKFF